MLRFRVPILFSLWTSLINPFSVWAAEEQQAPAPREFQVGVTAGLNGLLSNNELLKKNEGAEIGFIATLPVSIWREDANLIALRGQYTSFSNGIAVPAANGETVKLVNAAHSQLRTDFRQIFEHWNIQWSLGVGVQIPLTTSILTPRGEFNFADARNYYPEAVASLAKMDRSFAGYIRFGIDQKLLSDALLLGIALELTLIEAPKTDQRLFLNLYAGARIW